MKERLNIIAVLSLLTQVCVLQWFCGSAFAARGKDLADRLQPEAPRFELQLNLKEFSVLNSAARLGVRKYGGEADFKVKLARDANDVAWTITVEGARFMEVLEHWVAEKTAELVALVDFENLGEAEKSALATVKSLSAKIVESRANPIWDPVRLSGLMEQRKDTFFLRIHNTEYVLTGAEAKKIRDFKKVPAVVKGYLKVQGQIELIDVLKKKMNTLEVFVMSQCPAGMRAEASLIKFLKKLPEDKRPALEVRYIFYRKEEGKKEFFTCLHGEEELHENLVQMMIRDLHPDLFFDYLLARSKSGDSWEELAGGVGIGKEEVEVIRDAVAKARDALIEKEYDYVAGKHEIFDGSPTFVWESERIKDIREIVVFRDFEFISDVCLED